MPKFNPNATPICDSKKSTAMSMGDNDAVSLETAEALERRARVAEKKLKIALKLIRTLQPAQNTNIIHYIHIILEEIEGVGE
jgi:hypothetical protein